MKECEEAECSNPRHSPAPQTRFCASHRDSRRREQVLAAQRAYGRRNAGRRDARKAAWSEANPERILARRLRPYGLTPDDYRRMVAEQGSRCPICEESKPLHVDHDHACCPGSRSCGSCVRGLLCRRCNMALGGLRDSAETLRRALAYLETR